jgi:hypothetical protein
MSVDLRAEFEASQARMRTSLEQLSSATDTAVSLKFSEASASQNTKFQEANAKFAEEQKEVRDLVDELQKKWDLVQDGQLKALGDRLAEKETEDLARINHVAKVFRSEVQHVNDQLNVWKPSVESSHQELNGYMKEMHGKLMEQQQLIDRVLGAGGIASPPGFGGSDVGPGFSPQGRRGKGLEVRIPDPRNWALDVLQNGDKDWYAWRKAFDLHVRSVWGDLDKLLVEMRDYPEPLDVYKYDEQLKAMHIIPEGGNEFDYGFVEQTLHDLAHVRRR